MSSGNAAGTQEEKGPFVEPLKDWEKGVCCDECCFCWLKPKALQGIYNCFRTYCCYCSCCCEKKVGPPAQDVEEL